MLRIVGAALLAMALLAAVLMEVSGYGLVTMRPSIIPLNITPGPQCRSGKIV